jgi:hypothetical protein
MQIEVSIHPKIQAQRLKLAYVKHNFERYGFPNLTYFPDVIPMMDEPNTELKGRNIHCAENWWRYIEKINTASAYTWTRSIGKMWINAGYDNSIPYSTARPESVHCGGNFVAYDLETNTHVRLISFPPDADTSQLDPAVDNWMNKPYLFWKACAVERFGTRVINVANGLDVYFPLICNRPQLGKPAELWMRKQDLVLFGENEYTFRDGNVYVGGQLFHATGAIPP